MIPQYSKKQIISSHEEPLDTNVLWLDLQRDLEIKSPVLKYFNGEKWIGLSIFDYIPHIELLDKNAEPNFQHITQNQKDKLDNLYNYIHPDKHPTSILEGVNTELGDENTFLNKKGEFVTPITKHKDLIEKNEEANFQHVTQEEKTGFHTHNNKEYLDNYNPALFATALQGEKADSALQSLPPNTVIDADYPTLKNKVNGIEENANNYVHPLQHSVKILSEISTLAGDVDKYLNERGNFRIPVISHSSVTNKNAETAFRHVDTTKTKETLVEEDKVAILDSVTREVVFTDKSNVSGGARELLLTKYGFNSSVEPLVYPNEDKEKKIKGFRLASNCDNFEIQIAGTNYTKTSTYPIILPANTEIKVIDIEIKTGFELGNVIIIIE